jgi:coxsackievirus/adenovirus receptor
MIYSHQSASGGPSKDFLALSLNDGFVEFRYNLGSGTAVIRSNNRITVNEWHNTTAARTDRDGTPWTYRANYNCVVAIVVGVNVGSLVVDNEPPVNGFSPGGLSRLDVLSDLFVGGIGTLSQVIVLTLSYFICLFVHLMISQLCTHICTGER